MRAGLNVPQNTEALLPFSIRYISCGTVRTAPELINQQWRRKYDLPLYFRRAVTLVYPIEALLSAVIVLEDDVNEIDETVNVSGFVFGESEFGEGGF
jgi:hypothetical protein